MTLYHNIKNNFSAMMTKSGRVVAILELSTIDCVIIYFVLLLILIILVVVVLSREVQYYDHIMLSI